VYGAGDHEPFEQVDDCDTEAHEAPDGADDEYAVHVAPFAADEQPPDAAQPAEHDEYA